MWAPPGPDNTTALILAGGRSTRMGRPKAWMNWQGEALVSHVARRVGPQVRHHLLNLCPDDTHTLPGWQVVHDLSRNQPGPLAGMETGLHHCTTPWLLVVPCDMPRLPQDLLPSLATCLKSDALLVAARTQTRHFPVVALLHQRLLPVIREHLQQEKLKLMDWHRDCGGKWCLFNDATAFVNFNHPQDLDPPPP